MDWYSAAISVILVCIVEVVAVSWVYGVRNYVRDIEFMIGRSIERYWIVSWKIVTPLVLTFIFFTTIVYNTEVTYNGVRYPRWAIILGWASCFASMICIPGYAIYELARTRGTITEVCKLFS